MSALAKLLNGLGHSVSGSDAKPGPALSDLEEMGLHVWTGSRPESMRGVDLVVASSAIPDRDRELLAARDLGVPIWRRPRLLEAITAQIPTIGVTGTHGKTTSTAMMVAAATAASPEEAPPSFVVGGHLLSEGTNAAFRSSTLLVLEVDEAFGTFLDLHLQGLVVTNIEADHLDYYGSVDALEDAFAEVVRGVAGPVVLCGDDPGARRVAERTGRPTYGTADDAQWRLTEIASDATVVEGTVSFGGRRMHLGLAQPGRHTALNACGVVALVDALGMDVAAAIEGLQQYQGVHRRFERRGQIRGVTIIDDYAHHPTEIAATLATASSGGWRRIWAVFQPHRYSRTAELYAEFGAAFTGSDEVVVTDVYAAGETPVPGVTGALVADAVRARTSSHVTYLPHRAELAAYLAGQVRPGDLVLTLGAGDITLLGSELIRLLGER